MTVINDFGGLSEGEYYSQHNLVFVFGSNSRGSHGAGAARHAHLVHGAQYGNGEGLQGTSYAIPTKDEHIETMPLEDIQVHVDQFLDFAKEHPEITFMVSAIGCGLAGLSPVDVAHMFNDSPVNVKLPTMFLDILYDEYSEDKISFTW